MAVSIYTQAFALDAMQAFLQQGKVVGTAEQSQAAGIKLVHKGSPISVSLGNMGAAAAHYK